MAPNGPRITEEMMEQLPELRMIGDLEGDRFANRIDMDAAFARGIPVVDTTQGTSYPVSEWALGLTLIALKNAGADFRAMTGGEGRNGITKLGSRKHLILSRNSDPAPICWARRALASK